MKNAKILVALFVVLTMVTSFCCVSVYAEGGAKVDINKASKEELMQLEGVGDSFAQRIIEFRDINGPFEKPDDLLNVKGIGPVTLEKNKDRIMIVQAKQNLKKK